MSVFCEVFQIKDKQQIFKALSRGSRVVPLPYAMGWFYVIIIRIRISQYLAKSPISSISLLRPLTELIVYKVLIEDDWWWL